MTERDLLTPPKTVKVSFKVDPVYGVFDLLGSLTHFEHYSGMHPWVEETGHSMPHDLMHRHRVLCATCEGLFFKVAPYSQWVSFPAFLEGMAALDPVIFRDLVVSTLLEYFTDYALRGTVTLPVPTAAQIIADNAVYMRWQEALHLLMYSTSLKDDMHEYHDHEEAHNLYGDPHALHSLTVSHLRKMWYAYAEEFFMQNLPLIQDSVTAYQQLTFAGLTVYEAIRAVTGRDLRATTKWYLGDVEHIVFVPVAHLGPFLDKIGRGETVRILFSARLPQGMPGNAALSRSELLIRLGALADETRLKILEMLAQEGELCAQEIIGRLNIGQSSVSRHLSQLAATGYITERRRDINKCYTLNAE